MLRLCVALAALAAVLAAVPLSEPSIFTASQAEVLFNAWCEQHGMNFNDAEAAHRFSNFKYNLEFVARHNAEFAAGKQTYEVELNKLAHLSVEEYKAHYLGFRADMMNSVQNVTYISGDAPAEVDWRKQGAVTPVKNQGQCGSCWAFSTTGALEGANFIKTGKLVSLSEQELVDCDPVDQGCNGGLMDNAFDWVQKNGGIDTEDDFKYLGRRTLFFRCPAEKKNKHAATCSGKVDVPAGSEEQLRLAAAKQPVSVAIEADQSGFQLYKSGVFTGPCGKTLDHGVLLVGYGTEAGKDYWIVKNSWGTQWGDNGYIRIARGSDLCGIADAASYPTV